MIAYSKYILKLEILKEVGGFTSYLPFIKKSCR